MLQKCLFLLIVYVAVSKQECSHSTFNNVFVEIYQQEQKSEQMIGKCITPETIIYHPKKGLTILIQNKTIPVLYNGAISNFREDLLIRFEYNFIDTISEGAFYNLPKVERVRLTNNNISWIEAGAFEEMPRLATIILNKNRLEDFSQNTFYNLPELYAINLNSNRLRHFRQEWFNRTPKLATLMLNSNFIREIPRAAFSSLSSLQVLQMEDNLIEHIHKRAFEGQRSLRFLKLHNNRIKVLDFASEGLVGLFLPYNNITYISDEMLESLAKFTQMVDLKGNPLQCACFDKVLQWGEQDKIRVEWKCKGDEPICVVPKSFPEYCIQRTDEDFYEGYYLQFKLKCPSWYIASIHENVSIPNV